MAAVGTVMAFAPFVDWGKFLPSTQSNVAKRAKAELPDGTQANIKFLEYILLTLIRSLSRLSCLSMHNNPFLCQQGKDSIYSYRMSVYYSPEH
jgi:hypothetical protein